jgi:5-methylcytosine-specific restriction endonuclease McrA
MPSMFRSRPLRQPRTKPKLLYKESPRERGYSAAWDRFSCNFRQRKPFCAFCEQVGRLRFADVVDHKLPISMGGELLDHDNTHGLCSFHHNGLKAKLEAYAVATGQRHCLVEWCDRPDSRPKGMRHANAG